MALAFGGLASGDATALYCGGASAALAFGAGFVFVAIDSLKCVLPERFNTVARKTLQLNFRTRYEGYHPLGGLPIPSRSHLTLFVST